MRDHGDGIAGKDGGDERIRAFGNRFRTIGRAGAAPRCRAYLLDSINVCEVEAVDGIVAELGPILVGGVIDDDTIVLVRNTCNRNGRGRAISTFVDIAVERIARRREIGAVPVSASARNRDAHTRSHGSRTCGIDGVDGVERGIVGNDKIVPGSSRDSITIKAYIRACRKAIACTVCEVDVDRGFVGLRVVHIVEDNARRGLDEFAVADVASGCKRGIGGCHGS